MTDRTEKTSPDEEQLGRGWRIAARLFDPDREWELWSILALFLAAVALVAWGAVVARLGRPSLFAYVRVIPLVGVATVPLAVWGVLRSAMQTPALNRRRVAGFVTLLAVGIFCNVPLFAVPLATEGWKTDTEFRLPFEGEWYTLAGGTSVRRNYHAKTPAYRWGYDFAPVRDGRRFRGDGQQSSDYYCWERPVSSPAKGRVVRTITGHPDTEPGAYNRTPVLGNHVVIRVASGVYLFVGQMRKGSVDVERGETVERGERLGECGSSGQALAPHVHVHLQDARNFPYAQSLPLRFSNYRADGERVDRGMPSGGIPGGEPEGERVAPVEEPVR